MPARSLKSKCPKGKTRDRVTKRCRSKRFPGRRARSPKSAKRSRARHPNMSLKAHKRSLRLQREFVGYAKKGNVVANAMLAQQKKQKEYVKHAVQRLKTEERE